MVSAHTYTFGHVYYGLPTPLHIYTLVIILNLFYFRFIYSILYILHTLIFKNKSLHFASQYRIAQRYYLSSLKLSPLCNHRASPWFDSLGLALARTHFAYTRIRVVWIRFICLHPIYLLHLIILTPHTLPGLQKGWPYSRTFRSFCFMVFYLVWFRPYRHCTHITASIPLWLFFIFSISALFIVFCIYCTHLFQK